MHIGQQVTIKPNPDLNVWFVARITRISEETECEYKDFDGVKKFSFYTEGHQEDKQVIVYELHIN
jgi:hypothetical protein